MRRQLTTGQTILSATHPEDVFGSLPENPVAARAALAQRYRPMAREHHPDLGGDPKVFVQLGALHSAAMAAIETGRYGQRHSITGTILVRTRRHGYKVTKLAGQGKTTALYTATYEDDQPALIKVVRDPRDGPKLAHEAKVLKDMLSTEPEMFDMLSPYLPGYIEAFAYRPLQRDGSNRGKTRQAIAYAEEPGLYTLERVREAFPGGVHPKDAAWMMRRFLIALGLVHAQGWSHTALHLRHVLIQPAQHGLVLIDWKHAKPWTPELGGHDIADATGLMVDIIGDYPIPRQLKAFYGYLITASYKRLPGALDLKDEYDGLIEDLWGPRKFRPFAMSA